MKKLWVNHGDQHTFSLCGLLFQAGRTALHVAAEYGHIKVIELLLKHHTDPNAETTVIWF